MATIDLARIQPSAANFAAAAGAYDAALREQTAAADRLARAPADPAAIAGSRAAADALAAARAALAAARRSLDVVRLDELKTFTSADQLLGSISGFQVLGLFPVGVEAKLDGASRLRVRVWPDAISTSTHDPRLTQTEFDAGRQYWRAEGAATTDVAHRSAWRELGDALGANRAAWVALALTPTNRAKLKPGVTPVFPPAAMMDEAAPFVPRAGVLPDRWVVVGIRDGNKVFDFVGSPIPIDLAVGFDTTPSETAALANREGEPIQLPPRMRWMTDFALAKQAGMAMEIPLAAGIDRLDLLLVFGVRITQTPAESADALAAHLTGHRYSRGVAFVPQDTPTNNSAAGGSGMPSRSARIDATFDLERRPRSYPVDLASNGTVSARALGLDPAVLASAPASGAAPQLTAEPDGFEAEIARAMQTVLWQVSLGSALEDFVGLDVARTDALRDYFCAHVRAGGPVPALRVGRQPYGVLPVTLLDEFVPAATEGIDARLLPLLKAARTWWHMGRPSEVYRGTAEAALRHLGRSARLYAETTRQDPTTTAGNHWSTLARSLAVASRNTIGDSWRTPVIIANVEGQPQPVTRPTVDEATEHDLALLAAWTPDGVLGAAPSSSVLSRMARQAMLLEWGHFARAVCTVALGGDSLATEARGGIDRFTEFVRQAMLAEPTLANPTLAEEQRRIRKLVGTLGKPNPGCPGAARLASFRRALTLLAQVPLNRLEPALFGALDVCNHRVDAWMTSLASARLASLRAASPQGLVIGGWGCLQDVRPADDSDPQQRTEFIHTPSLDHAAAAAVLRSAARRAEAAGSSHADIDLSSRRVRLARWLLEGVRNGRSLGEMLGIRFERALKGTVGEAQLGALRGLFPSKNRAGVLDGLAVQQRGLSGPADPTIVAAAEGLDEALDALTDALTAESVYQLVKGNPGGALVDLERIANGEPPPPLRVTETPSSGSRLTHRIAAVVPVGAKVPGWTAPPTARSSADPLLDAWCGLVIGRADRISLAVTGAHNATVPVTLSSLSLAAIDVVLAGRGDASELSERLVIAAQRKNSAIASPTVRQDRSWKDLTGLCDAIARLIVRAEPLRPDALDVPDASTVAAAEDFGDLPARVSAATARLTSARDLLVLRTDAPAAVRAAAALGIRIPGVLLAGAPAPSELDALLAAANAHLAASASATTPREKLRALFGGELPGLVAFTPRNPAALITAGPTPPTSLLGGDTLAPIAWLDATARVRPAVARLSEVLQRVEIVAGVRAAALRVAQAPWTDGDRWIATSFAGAQAGKPPDGRLSLVIHAPAGFAVAQPVGGLLLDAWSEVVPAEKRDTAIALRFNSPNTRAPQSILLAVSPDPSKPWTADTLIAVLRDALDLTRMRMEPPTTLSTGGLLPMVWLGQRTGGPGISFSL